MNKIFQFKGKYPLMETTNGKGRYLPNFLLEYNSVSTCVKRSWLVCYGKGINWALPVMMLITLIYTACQMWRKLKTLDTSAEVISCVLLGSTQSES